MTRRWLRRRRTPPLRDWPVVDAADVEKLAREIPVLEERVLAELGLAAEILEGIAAEILEGIAEAERGETVSLGSFAGCCDDDGEVR